MLSATKASKAKPGEKQYKLYDAEGLYLLVKPSGGKYWRVNYRVEGKHKTLALGVYPRVTLKAARAKRDEAREKLDAGIDPAAERQATKAVQAETFEAVAREWFAKYEPAWAEGHSEKIVARLERDIFPWLGARAIGEIKAPELLAVLRRIEARGAVDTSHRARQNCGQIFRFAVATGRAERDPAADLRGALAPVAGGHFAAITEPKAVGELLRAIHGYTGSPVTRHALRLLALTFVRPGELRHAQWSEIDLEDGLWKIPAERMKLKAPHIVALSRQAVETLGELHPLTGQGVYVFPSIRTDERPMSENTICGALRRLGYDREAMTAHGFRAIARTLLDEELSYAPHLIEHQLAHVVRDPLGRSYNRTSHLRERREMMQAWADYLDGLREGAT